MPMLLVAGLVLALALVPASAGPARRVVVIQADRPDRAEARTQAEALLARAADLKDRDMVVVAVYGGAEPVQLFGEGPVPRLGRGTASPGATFLVTLFGKDGGEKLRSATPVSPDDLFALIDTMPMRRQEMRRQGARR